MSYSPNYRVDSMLIGDVTNGSLPHGLLFAGGKRCSQHFLIDPRVYQLVRLMSEVNKPVGCLYPISLDLVNRLSQPHSQRPVLLQEKLRLEQFLYEFTKRMTVFSPLFMEQAMPSSLLLT